MTDFSQLSDDEKTPQKKLFITILMLSLGIPMFFLIGLSPSPSEWTLLVYYLLLFAIMGLAPIFIDYFFKDKDLPIDTVTIEEPSTSFMTPKVILIGSVIASIIYAYFIVARGQALVDAPRFAISSFPFGGPLLSAYVGGIVESVVFFGFIYPTLHRLLYDKLGPLGIVLAFILGISIFTGFHFWAYSYSITSLVAVAFFGFINVLAIFTTRSLIPSILLHSVNNFAVTLLVIQKFSLFIVGLS